MSNMLRSFAGGLQEIENAAQNALNLARGVAASLPPAGGLLPEIIFLPGLPGSLLAEAASGDLVWLSFFRTFAGTLGRDLDPSQGTALKAAGMFPALYDVAAAAWRAAGFVVHEFPFDWRLPLSQGTHAMRALVNQRKAARAGVKFLPVAHSQGGLVVCDYARTFSDFQNDFARAVFLGTPFGGTYAALDALLGTASYLENIRDLLNALGRQGDALLNDAHLAACRMQGLAELLPAAGVFPSTNGLYDSAQYDAAFRPTAALLKAGEDFKKNLLDPTLLGRSTVIMSSTFSTAAGDSLSGGQRTPGTPQLGDGTTTLQSGLPAGLHDAFQARLQHMWLPIDPEVIQCVIEIGVLGNVDQTKHTALLAAQAGPAPALTSVTSQPQLLSGMANRFRNGMGRTSDWLWIFSS